MLWLKGFLDGRYDIRHNGDAYTLGGDWPTGPYGRGYARGVFSKL